MADEQQGQTTETDAKDKTQATTPAVAIPTETPAESQEIMIPKHRYDEVSNKLKALEAEQVKRAKEQEAENEKRLAEQAKWQELYEGSKGKLAELTPKAELADKLSELLATEYEARTKDWSDDVKGLSPSDDATIIQKWEWMIRATPLATAYMADKTPAPGNGRRPVPIAPANQAKAAEQQRDEWSKRARVRYR